MAPTLRAAWRAGPPEFLVVLGSAVSAVGLAGLFVLVLATDPAWAIPAALTLASLAAVAATVRLVRSRAPRRFLGSALLASAVAVLTPAGVVGGAIALVGATWGVVSGYEPAREP